MNRMNSYNDCHDDSARNIVLITINITIIIIIIIIIAYTIFTKSKSNVM